MESTKQIRINTIIVLILTLFSIIFSKHKLESLVYGLVILVCVIIFYMILNTKIKMNLEQIIKYWYYISIVVFVVGFVEVVFFNNMPSRWLDFSQYNNISFRMSSVFGNPNLFGFYIGLLLIFISTSRVYQIVKRDSMLEYLVYGLSVLCLYFTYSRANWIGLILTLLFASIFVNKGFFKHLLIIAGVILLLDFVFQTYRSDIESIMFDKSMDYRFKIWESSFKMIKDNWLTGIGINSFGSEISSYSTVVKSSVGHCHNVYLQILVEMGVVSFVVIGFIFVKSILRVLIRLMKEKDKTCAFIILITAFILVQGLVDSTMFVPPIIFIITAMYAIAIKQIIGLQACD